MLRPESRNVRKTSAPTNKDCDKIPERGKAHCSHHAQTARRLGWVVLCVSGHGSRGLVEGWGLTLTLSLRLFLANKSSTMIVMFVSALVDKLHTVSYFWTLNGMRMYGVALLPQSMSAVGRTPGACGPASTSQIQQEKHQ